MVKSHEFGPYYVDMISYTLKRKTVFMTKSPETLMKFIVTLWNWFSEEKFLNVLQQTYHNVLDLGR